MTFISSQNIFRKIDKYINAIVASAIFLITLNSSVFSRNINYLDFEVFVNNNPYPANIFVHTTRSYPRYMAIIDTLINPAWVVNSAYLGLDFKVNQETLSYFNGENNSWIILNEYMNEIDTLECANGYYADFHDLQLLDDGGYILQAYDSITVDMSGIDPGGLTDAVVITLVIQEFDSDKNLIFEWHAWEHLDIANYQHLDLADNVIHWMHGNSIDVDIDSNIIISNRRSSEVIKIDRYSGQIIWILGGPNNEFSIINDPYNGFSRQHDVRRIENGNILVFDNGNDHEPPISRALEYQLNEGEKTAELVWDFSHPNGYVGLSMGSIQRLPNNNTLINWGRLAEEGGVFTEVDYDKNIVLDIQYPESVHCYRVTKSNWSFDTNLITGDTNLDNTLDVMDISLIADYVSQEVSVLDIYHLFRFDINKDRSIDDIDINLLAQIIIGL